MKGRIEKLQETTEIYPSKFTLNRMVLESDEASFATSFYILTLKLTNSWFLTMKDWILLYDICKQIYLHLRALVRFLYKILCYSFSFQIIRSKEAFFLWDNTKYFNESKIKNLQRTCLWKSINSILLRFVLLLFSYEKSSCDSSLGKNIAKIDN